MTRQKNLTIFVTFFLALLNIAGANALANEAYWVDVTTNTRLDSLVLPAGQERLICLKAEVPANKTLKAYHLGIIYDYARVSVEVIDDPEYVFNLTSNSSIPGAVEVNGFDPSGVDGENAVILISLRVNGMSEFSSSLAVFFTVFASEENDQFIPSAVPLDINPISGWVSIWGRVLYEKTTPLCTMVLVNGQHMFSCRGKGRYALYVPVDSEGKLTVFCFGDGYAPYKEILTPSGPLSYDIDMDFASPDNPIMTLAKDYAGQGINNPDWVRISGTVYYGDAPLCAMVLANGQHMFTCDEAAKGQYELEVPLDSEGNITLFGFVDGLLQHKETFKP